MDKITITDNKGNIRELMYNQHIERFSDCEDCIPTRHTVTDFYEGYKTIYVPKWSWSDFSFIETPKVEPIILFSIDKDIKNEKVSSEWWRQEIRKKLSKVDAIAKRKKEISNNQLV